MPDDTPVAPAIRTVDVDRVLPRDEAQELKEAVCDAVLERTRRVVAGEGDFGAVIYGRRPGQALTSGFLLPRLNNDDDEEASDISIPVHGLDLRLHAGAPNGSIRIRPELNVYVRALPSADEIFSPVLGLRPKARFNAAATKKLDSAIASVKDSQDFRKKSKAEKTQARRAAVSEEQRKLGVVGYGITNLGDYDGDEDDAKTAGELNATVDEVRIPDNHSVPPEIPEKYIRLRVHAPVLELPLPFDGAEWTARAVAYERALNDSITQAFETWIDSEQGKLWAWRKGTIPGSSFWTKDAWDSRLTALRAIEPRKAELIPGMVSKFIVDTVPDPMSPDILTARFAIENFKEGPRPGEHGLFQVSMQVAIPKLAISWMHMERIKRSYHFAGLLRVPAIGVNGGVEHLASEHDEVLHTTWMPRFVLPRMRATEVAGVPVSYDALRGEDLDVANLGALPSAMEAWVTDVVANTVLSENGERGSDDDENRQQSRFVGDVAAWRAEAARIARGIGLLKRSQDAFRADRSSPLAVPYRAWLLTNRTFAQNGANPGWRLFQLAFILTHVPTLASRLPGYTDFFDQTFDEGSASLLYMSTGGGKSEAFFGVLMYALFLDRLRGKRRGVTAMIHYPLRLLTLQQARRLMRLLAQAEVIRHDEHLRGAPFEIGFWVGSNNTPNSTAKNSSTLEDSMKGIPSIDEDPTGEKEDEFRRDRPGYEGKNDSWNKLPTCPFCDPTGTIGHVTGLRLFPAEKQRLGIVCANDDCSWNKRQVSRHKRKPLPFLLVDTDIYRRAPAVLLGTVDKLALLGNHPSTINKLAGMFGLARFIEGDDEDGLLLTPNSTKDIAAVSATARKVAPSFAGGAEVFHDPLPSLIIQDELHLLEESLGTFGGIFEATLFAWLARLAEVLGHRVPSIPGVPGKPRMPHVIGATATAADAARQMEHLYQRKVVQFPHPGPRLYRSFYTELHRFPDGSDAEKVRGKTSTAREQEASAPWARVYASLLTNGKTHTSATIEVLTAYAVGITRWMRDLTSDDPARRVAASFEIEENLSDGALVGRHAAAVARARASRRFDVLASLVDLHRIMLTYVTNKKGGDQLMSALERRVFKDHMVAGPRYEIDAYDLELISGGVDIRGIQDVIAKAERPFEIGDFDISSALRGIVATSAISHGVDVNALNAMSFAGMPSDIAEYIQASSRVARTHVGFSLLVPTPQNRRDRFILENHETFHRFLERMISPPAIERWADKAIARTLPSLFQTYLAGVKYQAEFCRASDEAKGRVSFPGDVTVLKDMFSGDLREPNTLACLAFIEDALGVDGDCGGAPTKWHYKKMLRQKLDGIVDDLTSGRFGGNLSDFWKVPTHGHPQPMTSLRDVDEAGQIVGSTSGHSNSGRLVRNGDIRLAMDFLRNRRIAGKRTQASASELDNDGGGKGG